MFALTHLSGFGSGSAGGFTAPATAKSYTLNANNNSGNVTITLRTIIASIAAGGTQIRVRVEAPSNAACTVNNAAIGIRSGTTDDCTATPIELLFSGVSGFSLSASQTITSDWANLTTNIGDSLLYIQDHTTAANWRELNSGGDGFYFLSGAASYNSATISGTTFVSGRTEMVNLVEVRSAA